MPPPTVRRSVNLPPSIDVLLRIYAESHELTITETVVRAIQELSANDKRRHAGR